MGLRASSDLQKILDEAAWAVAQRPKWKRSKDTLDSEVFWKNGERWFRDNEQEVRMYDLAPELEAAWIANLERNAAAYGMKAESDLSRRKA